MICVVCKKNKVSTSKIFRHIEEGLEEVEIVLKCTYCRSKERQIEKLHTDINEMEDKLHLMKRKLTEIEYKLFSHIYS